MGTVLLIDGVIGRLCWEGMRLVMWVVHIDIMWTLLGTVVSPEAVAFRLLVLQTLTQVETHLILCQNSVFACCYYYCFPV